MSEAAHLGGILSEFLLHHNLELRIDAHSKRKGLGKLPGATPEKADLACCISEIATSQGFSVALKSQKRE
ncbi:hypothetical protein [Teichococcus oryzae]|uniref:Uncharacterized protein n=1 Tax=Teichococcus oryzae TaxID=1608942 RepID=A0A5B2TC65_9PROT|nr:hypothetical protein [Pseudoroseomonas oryzae]KAA2212091.1 hypothetical protein F0Q34_16595 [Pseudoroseomonas oryzae]